MAEIRHLAYALRNPLLWAAILLSLIVAAATYQLPFSYAIDMGSPASSPYVTNFYPPQEAEGRAARWGHAYSYVTLPGTGGNRQLRVTVDYNPSRAGVDNPPPVTVTGIVGGEPIYTRTMQPPVGWQIMQLDVDASHPQTLAQRDLQVELRTDVYRPPDYQGNELGILVSRVTVEPLPGAPWQPVVPNLRVMVLMAALTLGIYLLLARLTSLRAGPRPVHRIVAGVALLAGLALAIGVGVNVVAVSEALLPLTAAVYGVYLIVAGVSYLWPRISATLRAEGRAISLALRYRPLIILLVFTPLAFSFGIQAPVTYRIDIGSGRDAPFVRDFNPPMFPLPDGTPGNYRTTSAHSYITIPGVGSDNVYSVTLRLNPGTGPASAGDIRVLANGSEAARKRLAPGWQDVGFEAASGPARAFSPANLQIDILSPAELVEGGEQRGALVDWVTITQTGSVALISRSPAHEAGLLMGVLLLYLLVVRFAGLHPTMQARRLGLLAATLTVFVVAWGLRLHRVDILAVLPHLLFTLFIGYVLLGIGNRESGIGTDSRLPTPDSRFPLFSLAFMLRFGFAGLPQLIVVDLPYHLKWLGILIGGDFGKLYFPGELSSVPPEWNLNVLIPKSPLFYVAMWPLGLVRGLDLGPALLFLVSLMDAAMVLVVFAIVKSASADSGNSLRSWAWWAALIYALTPLAFRALAFGILPTIFAQALTLVSIAIPTLWPERLRRPVWLALWVLLLAASMIAFPTVLVFNSLVVVMLALIWAWQRASPGRTLTLMLGGLAAALALSFLAYYDLYVGPFLSTTLPALAGGTTVGGNRLWPGGVPELLGWTAAYVVNWLPLLLLPIAILYIWPVGNQISGIRSQKMSRLAVLLLAWLVVLVIGLALNLRFDMIGKHLYYTISAAAIAAGVVLSTLWRRAGGRPYTRAVALLAALSIVWSALAFMAERL